MKKLRKPNIAFLLAFLMLFISCEQEGIIQPIKENKNIEDISVTYNKDSYFIIMTELQVNIDNVLTETKPQGITLDEYKLNLLKGKLKLSENTGERILQFTEPLNNYGKYIAKKNNIEIDINNKNLTLALGGLFKFDESIGVTFSRENLISPERNNRNLVYQGSITLGDVGRCILVALGADALFSLGVSSATAWSAAALTSAFSAIAKRFLGPIGVAIAVVSFGLCLLETE